jgi:hypothetical protein
MVPPLAQILGNGSTALLWRYSAIASYLPDRITAKCGSAHGRFSAAATGPKWVFALAVGHMRGDSLMRQGVLANHALP